MAAPADVSISALGLYVITKLNRRGLSVAGTTKKRHTVAKSSRPPLVAHAPRPVFHAVEGPLGPHEFRRKNQQTNADDDEAWSGQNKHRRPYRQEGETNHRRNDRLHMSNHLYFDCSKQR